MKQLVIYIHGKGGSIEEAEHYKLLFINADVIGFDYQSQTPCTFWMNGSENQDG